MAHRHAWRHPARQLAAAFAGGLVARSLFSELGGDEAGAEADGGSEGDASFDCGEPGVFSDEWIDRITGLENVMARAPDGREMFEVVRFHSQGSCVIPPGGVQCSS